MNIAPAHLEALKALGYTEAEARFLYIVATHSGYFVARQFLAFTGCPLGQAHDHFLEQTSRQETRANRMLSEERRRSTTSSPAASIARSNARTSAIAGNTKSNTSSGASECSISFS